MEPGLGDPQYEQYGAQSLRTAGALSHSKVYKLVNGQDHILVIERHGPCGYIRTSFCLSDLLQRPLNYNLSSISTLHRHSPSRTFRDLTIYTPP
jgi:hypothetical protein